MDYRIDMRRPDFDQPYTVEPSTDPHYVWIRTGDGLRQLVPRENVDLVPTGIKDPTGRQILLNSDLSTSSEQAVTVEDSRLNRGRATNIPTIFDGKKVSDDTAIRNIAANNGIDPETGRRLPGYAGIDEAILAETAHHKKLEGPPPAELEALRARLMARGDLPSGRSVTAVPTAPVSEGRPTEVRLGDLARKLGLR